MASNKAGINSLEITEQLSKAITQLAEITDNVKSSLFQVFDNENQEETIKQLKKRIKELKIEKDKILKQDPTYIAKEAQEKSSLQNLISTIHNDEYSEKISDLEAQQISATTLFEESLRDSTKINNAGTNFLNFQKASEKLYEKRKDTPKYKAEIQELKRLETEIKKIAVGINATIPTGVTSAGTLKLHSNAVNVSQKLYDLYLQFHIRTQRLLPQIRAEGFYTTIKNPPLEGYKNIVTQCESVTPPDYTDLYNTIQTDPEFDSKFKVLKETYENSKKDKENYDISGNQKYDSLKTQLSNLETIRKNFKVINKNIQNPNSKTLKKTKEKNETYLEDYDQTIQKNPPKHKEAETTFDLMRDQLFHEAKIFTPSSTGIISPAMYNKILLSMSKDDMEKLIYKLVQDPKEGYIALYTLNLWNMSPDLGRKVDNLKSIIEFLSIYTLDGLPSAKKPVSASTDARVVFLNTNKPISTDPDIVERNEKDKVDYDAIIGALPTSTFAPAIIVNNNPAPITTVAPTVVVNNPGTVTGTPTPTSTVAPAVAVNNPGTVTGTPTPTSTVAPAVAVNNPGTVTGTPTPTSTVAPAVAVNNPGTVTGTPPPVAPTPATIYTTTTLSATLSNTTGIKEHNARIEAEKKLEERYKNGGFIEKLNIFINRSKILENDTKNSQKKMGIFDEESVEAAGRHGLEKTMGFLSEADTLNNPNLNGLCTEYIHGNGRFQSNKFTQDDDFKKYFKAILKNDFSFKDNEIEKYGTDIILMLQTEKAHQEFTSKIHQEVLTLHKDGITDETVKHRYRLAVADHIRKYIAAQKQHPRLLQELGLNLNDTHLFDNLAFQKDALDAIRLQKFNINLSKITEGQSASNIKDDRIYGLDKRSLDKRMEKFEKMNVAQKIGIFAGSVVVIGGAGAIGGPIAGLIFGGGIAGMRNALKKRVHYTQSHDSVEKGIAENLDKEMKKRETLETEIKNMKFLDKYTSRKNYKKMRQVELYRETMQKMENVKLLNQKIENTIASFDINSLYNPDQKTFDDNKQYIDTLLKSASEGLAYIAVKNKTGRNFLGANSKQDLEKETRELYQNINTISKMTGITLEDMKNDVYDKKFEELEGDFGDKKSRMENKRFTLGIKYFASGAGLYAATRGVMNRDIIAEILGRDSALPTKDISLQSTSPQLGTQSTPDITTATIPNQLSTTPKLSLDVDIKDDILRIFGEEKTNQLITELNKNPTNEHFWDIVQKLTGNDQQATNEIKNKVCAILLNATENGRSEILQAAFDNNLPVSPSDAGRDGIMQNLIKKGIATTQDAGDISEALSALKNGDQMSILSGSKLPNGTILTPELKTKVVEFAFHRSGNENMQQIFMDMVQNTDPTITTPIVPDPSITPNPGITPTIEPDPTITTPKGQNNRFKNALLGLAGTGGFWNTFPDKTITTNPVNNNNNQNGNRRRNA